MKDAEIVFRVDGDSIIGLGHIYRCLALAEIFSKIYSCTFAIRNPSVGISELLTQAGHGLITLPEKPINGDEPDYLLARIRPSRFVFFDGYSFDELYIKSFSEAGKKIVMIDDLGLKNRYADGIINHAPGFSTEWYAPEKATLYLGPAYAMLREPFRSSTPCAQDKPLDNLLIAFGGADPENFTCKTLELLMHYEAIRQITVITGNAFQHLTKLKDYITPSGKIKQVSNLTASEMFAHIQSAGVAIVPASTVLFEVLSTGTLALAGFYVENQRKIYDGFLSTGAIHGLGDFRLITKEVLTAGIELVQRDTGKCNAMRQAMKLCFDGRISERFLGILEEINRER